MGMNREGMLLKVRDHEKESRRTFSQVMADFRKHSSAGDMK